MASARLPNCLTAFYKRNKGLNFIRAVRGRKDIDQSRAVMSYGAQGSTGRTTATDTSDYRRVDRSVKKCCPQLTSSSSFTDQWSEFI